ncbi:hypothetical protein UCDDS831_g06113 [Diplodia seriata]|uniref:Uncharacterized protein n=1 Tax=Diplodia seriata TaxID=420778 RepID=A0A0G2E6V6_9PEZI|nr:hypothetical protein UCDDS831_g06113 [Diplodia seriata]
MQATSWTSSVIKAGTPSKAHIEERRVVKSARIPTDDRDDPGARRIQQLHSNLERMVKEFGDGKQDLVKLTVLGMRYAIWKSIKPYLRSFPGENPFHDFGRCFHSGTGLLSACEIGPGLLRG